MQARDMSAACGLHDGPSAFPVPSVALACLFALGAREVTWDPLCDQDVAVFCMQGFLL